jgi:GTP-sensing pleiotropic transcriptional regulator CodY
MSYTCKPALRPPIPKDYKNKLDTKWRVLLAIYNEHQKDVPNMQENIAADKLLLNQNVLVMALRKLDNEGLIKDIEFLWINGTMQEVFIYDMLITVRGMELAEQILHG